MNYFRLLTLLLTATICNGCITLLDNKWRPHSLETRAAVAQVVVSTRTLSKFPIPNRKSRLYGANFEVLSILKGWAKLRLLSEKGSPSVQAGEKLIISALGFGDRRHCWSSVDVDETYILFLSVNNETGYLVAKYLGAFGAAELLYRPSEDAILLSLGWKSWSSWSGCSRHCDGGVRRRTRTCVSKELCRGPREETKKCNTFNCKGTVDVLRNIQEENINTKQSNCFQKGIFHGELLRIAPNAMTYLMFPENIPTEFSILLIFKAALFLPHYIFTLYDSNNRMQIGVKLGPGVLTFQIGSANDLLQDRVTHSFAADFRKDTWHQIGISVSSTELIVTQECSEIGKASLEQGLMGDLDLFGAIYIGADESEGASRFFPGQVSQINIVADPTAIKKQCGSRFFFSPLYTNRQAAPPYLAGPAVEGRSNDLESSGGDQFGIDEEIDGEDEHGSGKAPCTVTCLNGGRCVNQTKCLCTPGWSGNDCGQAICEPQCRNGGNCLSPGVCKCSGNYDGSYCQHVKCNPTCLNGGVCAAHRLKCKCLTGFFGKRCEHRFLKLNRRICKKYVTRQVSYLRPVTKTRVKEYKVPCGIMNLWKCTKKRLIYYKTKETSYRQEYACAE